MNRKQLGAIILWLRIFFFGLEYFKLIFKFLKINGVLKFVYTINFQTLINMLLLIILIFHINIVVLAESYIIVANS